MTGSDPHASSLAKLHLRCPSFQEFIEEYSPRISSDGILLPVDEELPEGTPVEFEITLSDDFRVLRGAGAVAWFESAGEAAQGGAGGLAVRFTNLDNPGRRLIDRLVERHRVDGGRAFALVRWPDSIDAAAEPAGGAPLLPTPEPPLGESQSAAPELVLSSSESGPSPHRESPPLSPGRPSRTPAGDESVLIPAPALDGEPLPAETWPVEPPPLEPPATEETTWEAPSSSSAMEPLLEGPEGSPVDTLHVPPVPRWEGRSTAAVDPAELAMETVRVESFEPLTPAVALPRSAQSETDVTSLPTVPMAGVARAGSARASGRRLLLLLLLAMILAAVWMVRSDRVAPLWDRLAGRSSGSVEEVPARTAPAARAAATARAQEPVVSTTSAAAGSEDAASPATEPGGEEVAPAEAGSASPPEAEPVPIAGPTRSLVAELRARQAAAPPESAPARAAASATLAPLTRVLAIESERRNGETEVRLIADGRFTDGAFNGTRVQGGTPRILIRVLGVAQPYAGSTVEIGSPEVTRLRIGVHQSGARTDLHFVADLTSEAIRLVSAEAEGTILRLRFAR
jgi:PilZ domain